ncbi:MAG: hypothetical protein ACQESR_01085 [Planctomycetota bacterium]
MESCPTQALLRLVGLAAEKVIRQRYNTFPSRGSGTRSLSPYNIPPCPATNPFRRGTRHGIGKRLLIERKGRTWRFARNPER